MTYGRFSRAQESAMDLSSSVVPVLQQTQVIGAGTAAAGEGAGGILDKIVRSKAISR